MVNLNQANTGSIIDRQGINSSLSTQIIIKVHGVAIGAMQKLQCDQDRDLERVKEIGTDGIIEIVPKGPTTFNLSCDRIVFDQLRLPEAFSRGFKFINAQRLPFDIEVYDMSGIQPVSVDPAAVGVNVATDTVGTSVAGIAVVVYKNCWFKSYNTPYSADNYIITETAQIWAETAYVSVAATPGGSTGRWYDKQTDDKGIESQVNSGGRRGAMDAGGILNSIFGK